jgi:hypothetical protein
MSQYDDSPTTADSGAQEHFGVSAIQSSPGYAQTPGQFIAEALRDDTAHATAKRELCDNIDRLIQVVGALIGRIDSVLLPSVPQPGAAMEAERPPAAEETLYLREQAQRIEFVIEELHATRSRVDL